MYTQARKEACAKWYERRKAEAGELCWVCRQRPKKLGSLKCAECAHGHYYRNNQRKRSSLKAQIVEYLGDKCKDCGFHSEYYEVFDTHHRDPEAKDFNLSEMMRRHAYLSFEDIKDEIDKCDLLCANCHRIRHAKENR